MTTTPTPAPQQAEGERELPDSIRVPLHHIWADAGYLVGRAINGERLLAVDRFKALADEVECAVRAALSSPQPTAAAPAEAPPVDDMFVAVGCRRFSDGKIQTPESLKAIFDAKREALLRTADAAIAAVPAEAPSADRSDRLIEAGHRYAQQYDDDDREQIKTDVLNAFFHGADWVFKDEPPSTPRQLPQGGEQTIDSLSQSIEEQLATLGTRDHASMSPERFALARAAVRAVAERSARSEPVRRPLTVEHLREIYRYMDGNDVSFARAIERWHQIGGDA